jgi:hypothetical protein
MQQKIIRVFIALVCTGILCFFAYATFSFTVSDITPRAYVAMVLADTTTMRKSIAKNLSEGKSASDTQSFLIQAEENKRLMNIDFVWITSKGAIVIFNKEYGVIIVQEPTGIGETVGWSCTIYPETAKPNYVTC